MWGRRRSTYPGVVELCLYAYHFTLLFVLCAKNLELCGVERPVTDGSRVSIWKRYVVSGSAGGSGREGESALTFPHQEHLLSWLAKSTKTSNRLATQSCCCCCGGGGALWSAWFSNSHGSSVTILAAGRLWRDQERRRTRGRKGLGAVLVSESRRKLCLARRRGRRQAEEICRFGATQIDGAVDEESRAG